ncbi:MAG: DUF1192 family protein [Alphaproteobacteria bacterium]|nr:DUF1192 family protein [Alphaproteobacteria bacterium]MDE2041599.1 DUF1192 domain-containing protein [Alphaproteobacteria bacterium]MDE2340203.1 DUF1192 domain-containing protein [Alphaproteobacteria bacterium]
MDTDELFISRPDDPMRQLVRQELDPLSLDELHARIIALQAEIERTRAHLSRAASHKQAADALFRK